MAPACDQTGLGLQRMIAGPQTNGKVDRAKLMAIVKVGDFAETDSAYNERTCSAQVTVGNLQMAISYRVRQSEGLQTWYDINFVDPNNSSLQGILALAQADYASAS
jgi:hypothetical protein